MRHWTPAGGRGARRLSALAVAALVWAIVCSSAAPASPGEGSQVGDVAADFTLYDTEDKERSLYDYSGNVIVINFYTAECPFCREELPDLEENIWQVYQSKGVQVLGVTHDDASTAQDAIDTYELTYPVLLDPDRSVWATYEVIFIPLNLVIDRDMVIQYRAPGYVESDIIAEIDALIGTPVEQTAWGRIKHSFR